jgi:hypothetical protein
MFSFRFPNSSSSPVCAFMIFSVLCRFVLVSLYHVLRKKKQRLVFHFNSGSMDFSWFSKHSLQFSLRVLFLLLELVNIWIKHPMEAHGALRIRNRGRELFQNIQRLEIISLPFFFPLEFRICYLQFKYILW